MNRRMFVDALTMRHVTIQKTIIPLNPQIETDKPGTYW